MQAYSGLSNAFAYLNLHVSLENNMNGIVRTFVGILLLGSVVLMCNLILHVFIRGFWVGTVGLRSVQEKINIDELGYSKFFTEKLKERVASLDKILERLDTLASVIFSFTFLVVFMFLSLFLYFLVVSLFSYLVNTFIHENLADGTLKTILENIAVIIVIVWLVMGIAYMIDTLSLGFMKKFQKVSKIYFPVYKIIGVITLAGMYRSIYYSLINRFSKNKIRIALGFYTLLFVLLPFMKYDQYIYYPDNGTSIKLNDLVYDDTRADEGNIWHASIPSKFVKESFIPLFIRYRTQHNTMIEESCPDWKPLKKDGFNSGIQINSSGVKMGNASISESNPEEALECLSKFYTVSIDSIKLDAEYYLYRHPNNKERGIITIIDSDNLSRGKHEIDIKYKKLNDEKIFVDIDYVTIPFWVDK